MKAISHSSKKGFLYNLIGDLGGFALMFVIYAFIVSLSRGAEFMSYMLSLFVAGVLLLLYRLGYSFNYLLFNAKEELSWEGGRFYIDRRRRNFKDVTLVEMKNIYVSDQDDFFYFRFSTVESGDYIFTSLCLGSAEKKFIIDEVSRYLNREELFFPFIT